MAKLDLKIRYLCQDKNGSVHASLENNKPYGRNDEWFDCDIYYVEDGKENPNWRDTLIDLDKHDYEFEDGILRRIER